MLLGTLIAQLSDEAGALEMLTSLEDPVLLARLRAAADAAGESLGNYALAALGDFVTRADDAAWLSLMAVTSKSDDPGKACLRYMLGTELARSKSSLSRHH